MSQLNSGDWPIDPNTTTGNDIADKLNRLTAAILSGFSGSGRPPNAQAGMAWMQEIASGGYELMVFDGTDDYSLLQVDDSGDISFTGTPTNEDLNNAISSLQSQISAVNQVPDGGIILWSGAISAIPGGWALCDGSQGTPNLTDRFVVGAGGSYSVSATGGKDSITEVPKHRHGFSGTTNSGGNHNHGGDTHNDGDHNHQWWLGSSGNGAYLDTFDVVRKTVNDARGYSGSGSLTYLTADHLEKNLYTSGPKYGSKSNGSGGHKHGISNSGSHKHGFSGTSDYEGPNSVDIRPKYYALAYIMKV